MSLFIFIEFHLEFAIIYNLGIEEIENVMHNRSKSVLNLKSNQVHFH